MRRAWGPGGPCGIAQNEEAKEENRQGERERERGGEGWDE